MVVSTRVRRHDGPVSTDDQLMVGRDTELAGLRGLVADAAAGRGRVALVLGEAGIGKTSLAEAADALAREAGFDVGWGRCPAAEAPPYWPWTQVLGGLQAAGDLLEPGRFASGPELFAAVAEAIEERCRRGPVLVIVEDLHWADRASRDLLAFLIASVPGQRLLLLVTARDSGPDSVLDVDGAGVRRFELSGLDRHETGVLVQRIVGASATESYVDEVHRRTSGNPFFASEVARLQASRGTATGTVPTAVRQVLEHRLARLHQPTFELLQLASVLGSPDVGLLSRVSGLSRSEVEVLLEEPVATRVVVGGEFAHDLLRETLYLGISPSRRAELHRRAAEHLEGEGPAELARHWSLASGEDARQHAAELAVVAGDMCVAGLAHEQAVGHYRMAVTLGLGTIGVRRRLGEAEVQAGRIGAGRETLRQVARAAREAGDGEDLARAVLAMGGGIGGFEVDLSDSEQIPLLEEALRLLPDEDGGLRAAVLARLSLARAGSASLEERAALADEAVAMAHRVGDAEAEAAALAAMCDARSGPDHVRDRIEAADRMLVLGRDNAAIELLSRRLRLRARLELGDLSGVDADLGAYARTAERLRSPTYEWLVPMWRGMRAELDGDLATASSYAEEVAALADTAQSTNAEMMSWTLRWRVGRRSQDATVMNQMAEKMTEWTENFSGWDCTYALIFAESGAPERGRRHLRRLMEEGLSAVPRDSEWLELLWSLGEAAMVLDERDAAVAVRDALLPYADLWAVDGWGAACFGQVADLLARLAEYAGRPAGVPVPADRAAFLRSGATWTLEFRGVSGTVVDSKGMRDLAVLLARPGQEVHVLDLVEAAGGPSRAMAGGDTGPVLDSAARAAYRSRLVELEEELDSASLDGDQGRLEQAQSEKEFLLAELSSALGLAGRARRSGDPVERARKAVTMRIATAQKAIEAVHPDLARHLRNSVATGRFCAYRPDQAIAWQTPTDIATPDVTPSR